MYRKRRKRRDHKPYNSALSTSAEEAFVLTFADLTFILLAFFVFLDAIAVPDAIIRSGVMESISSHFVYKNRASDDVARTSTGIIEIAKEANFRVVKEKDRYHLTIPSKELFASGDDQVKPQIIKILGKIAAIILREKLFVTIEGHTDNRPINTLRFPSNWELSAARASSVLRIFLEHGVPEQQLAAAGRGEHQPISSNETVAGRAENRRVVLIVTGKK